MLISIITATYNSADYIVKTYNSIKSQTFENWEWLVTDDCSADSTFELLTKISLEDCRVKIFKNEINSGAAIARNYSLSMARGSFVAFIDSDDLWLPDKLLAQSRFMGDNNVNFSFTSYEIMNDNGSLTGKIIDQFASLSVSYDDMLRKRATIGCSTVMLRQEFCKGILMPNIRTGQDYAMWLELLRAGEKALLFPQVLTRYRISPNSISRNKLKKALRQWKIYRDVESLGIFKSLVSFSFYAYRAVSR